MEGQDRATSLNERQTAQGPVDRIPPSVDRAGQKLSSKKCKAMVPTVGLVNRPGKLFQVQNVMLTVATIACSSVDLTPWPVNLFL